MIKFRVYLYLIKRGFRGKRNDKPPSGTHQAHPDVDAIHFDCQGVKYLWSEFVVISLFIVESNCKSFSMVRNSFTRLSQRVAYFQDIYSN